ncbi:polymorphic toxin-type HINT domain-containing protein [Kitasatospora sp. NPDC058218]|uniref:polymorphic toxin-type HINT domain-containing protein n=1 Tax=Kitasatospora sp. NPDC058218 TaxID=3346385 RepID=UPI0036DABF38
MSSGIGKPRSSKGGARFRWLARGVLPVTLLASLLSTAQVASGEQPAPPPLSDRGRVLKAWREGGPSVRATAEIALAGTTDQVRLFLGAPDNPAGGELAAAEAADNRLAAVEMVTIAGPRVRAAAQAALSSGDAAVAVFLQNGYKAALESDQRLLTTQIGEAGGPRTKEAAFAAVAQPAAQLRAFLEDGQYAARESDDRLRLVQVTEAGGPAVKAAGTLAYDGTLEEIREFLDVGQHVARARDQEFASIAELAKQAGEAGDQADREKAAAIEASERARVSAQLAKEAAEKAAAETKAAKDDTARAEAAANRAAEAGRLAGEAATAATAAAARANNAAKLAASAASQAAGAAIKAGQAATRALNAAAAGKKDEDAAAGAAKAAELSGFAASAAARAANSAQQAAIAADATKSAEANITAASNASDEAGGYANQSGAAAGKARQAASSARKGATEAARQAGAAASLARQAAGLATEAGNAATSASQRAARAAESARDASAHAGNAHNAAEQSAAHAASAQQAANDATDAVAKAEQIHALAQATEAEQRTARTASATLRAEQANNAYQRNLRAAEAAKATAQRLNAESEQLAQQAAQPGTPSATVVTNGRKMALAALKTKGPWSKAAAEYALAGNDEAVIDYALTGWKQTREQDAHVLTEQIAANSPYESVRTAATAALAGDPAQLEAFTVTGQHQAALSQYRVKVVQIAEAGGPRVKEAGYAAYDTNTLESLTTFLSVTQYSAKESDDRLRMAQLQQAEGPEVKAAATVAYDSPLPALVEFLDSGQYYAARLDELAASHVASVENLIEGARQAAAWARQSASLASQAAAAAAGSASQAEAAAAGANQAAGEAAAAAQKAQAAASRAQGSADKAAAAAKTARAAQDRAAKSASAAQLSSQLAQGSAAAARASANTALGAVAAARTSAENAGKSRDEAQAIATTYLTAAVTEARQKAAQQVESEDALWRALAAAQQQAKVDGGASWYDYLSTGGHLALDFAGLVPIVGDLAADGSNCVWYQGEVLAGYKGTTGEDMLLSCISIIPVVGYGSAAIKFFKWGEKGSEAAGDVLSWLKSKNPFAKPKPPVKPKLPECLDSFPTGTRVLMGDGTAKPIQDIRQGDKVAAADPLTGESGPREVTNTIYTPDDRDFTELTVTALDGKTSTITSTDHHPFWTVNTGQWTDAHDLATGDTLRTDTGATAQIASVRHWTGLEPAHNLTVDDLHTYYVLAGDTTLLTHNCPTKLLDAIYQKLGVRLNDEGPTMGQIMVPDKDGKLSLVNEIVQSGSEGKASVKATTFEISDFLRSLGNKIYQPPSDLARYASFDHVETKVAWNISKGNVPSGSHVIINNTDGICRAKEFGGDSKHGDTCWAAMFEVLYTDQTMVVHYPTKNGNWIAMPVKGRRAR